MSDQPFCPECGSARLVGTVACATCGRSLEPVAESLEPAARARVRVDATSERARDDGQVLAGPGDWRVHRARRADLLPGARPAAGGRDRAERPGAPARSLARRDPVPLGSAPWAHRRRGRRQVGRHSRGVRLARADDRHRARARVSLVRQRAASTAAPLAGRSEACPAPASRGLVSPRRCRPRRTGPPKSSPGRKPGLGSTAARGHDVLRRRTDPWRAASARAARRSIPAVWSPGATRLPARGAADRGAETPG